MSLVSLNIEEEKRIIEAARKDKNQFEPLYIHYKKHIEDFFTYRVNDKENSEELTSRVFEKVLKGLDNFQWQGYSFSAWLYRIARNTLIDYYRENNKKGTPSQISENTNVIDQNETPQQHVETMFAEDLLYKVLNELPSRERDIIYMKFFDGYTNRVISELTGLSETNVGTIIYRAIRKLKVLYMENGS